MKKKKTQVKQVRIGNEWNKKEFVIVLGFVLCFVTLGVAIVGIGRALTPTQSLEPETGVLASGAVTGTDSTASGGSYVKFPSASPSGQVMPVGDLSLDGHTWHQVVDEDFTKDAALGSWGSACGTTPVYTGATGTQWNSYPTCYHDTYQARPYRADQVLSVHDGTLDFWLHTVDGKPAGANPSPILSGGSSYQTYGVYSARLKTSTTALTEFYAAWLLWPVSDANYTCAESDFPESQLSSGSVNAFSHYCNGGNQQAAFSSSDNKTQWHTYTQEWGPGKRSYYLDGVLIGSTTNSVWSQPQRWQLQTETNTNCDQTTPITCNEDGHLLVDWAVVYSY